MFGLGFGEVLIILLIALIFIGPKKLPELAKGLGKGIREFQDAAKGFTDQLQNSGDDATKHNLPGGETPPETLNQIADAHHHHPAVTDGAEVETPETDPAKKENPHS